MRLRKRGNPPAQPTTFLRQAYWSILLIPVGILLKILCEARDSTVGLAVSALERRVSRWFPRWQPWRK